MLPELLAPAGSLDALYAALAAGADAVYTGLGAFNARAAAHDLDEASLARACALAHAQGSRVYVTENVYLCEGEMEEALDLARTAAAAGANALIVADAGLARELSRHLPKMEVHLSTQAGVMSAAGVRLAAERLGAERVTCARELSVAEISALTATGVPIEVFCHGAICICYSGACAFSALRRGRSANRGDCTQPCRLSYRLEDAQGASVSCAPGDRLLCPHDYLSVYHLGELCAAGVSALKIEGRMKNPDYVYNVVSTYRRVLDALAEEGASDGGVGGRDLAELSRRAEERLARSFNRGFTDAYLKGTSDMELMSTERAINQGAPAGTVVSRGYHEVEIELTAPVGVGDTLEIRTILPADAAPDVPVRWPQVPCTVDGAAGQTIRVACKRRVAPGSPVHLTASAKILDEAARAVGEMRRRAEALEVPAPAPASAAPQCTALLVSASDPAAALPQEDAAPRPEVTVLCDDPAVAQGLLDGTPDGRPAVRVAVSAYRLLDAPALWEPLLGRMVAVLDEPCRAADEDRVRNLCGRARTVICRNLGEIPLAQEAGVPFETAAPISATNAATVSWLQGLGARRVWLPDELTAPQAAAVCAAAGPGSCGMLVYGRPQLMVCEHCLLSAEGPCPRDHATCPRRARERFLVEGSGARLPVRVDALGRTRIYDSGYADRISQVPELTRAGLGACLVDASGCSPDELRSVLQRLEGEF